MKGEGEKKKGEGVCAHLRERDYSLSLFLFFLFYQREGNMVANLGCHVSYPFKKIKKLRNYFLTSFLNDFNLYKFIKNSKKIKKNFHIPHMENFI